MTNEEMLDDLKQYLDLKLDAQETRLKKHTEEIVSERIDTVLDALGASAESVDAQLDNHETRITKLETKIA